MAYRLIHEDDHHFIVQDHQNKTFPIAKKGLGKAVIKRIQAFADGGEVAPAPAYVDPMAQVSTGGGFSDLATKVGDFFGPSHQAEAPGDLNTPEGRQNWLKRSGLNPSAAKDVAENVMNAPGITPEQLRSALMLRGASPDTAKMVVNTLHPEASAVPAAAPVAKEAPSVPESVTPPTPAQPTAPPPVQMPAVPSFPGMPGGLGAAEKLQERGADDYARAVADEAKAQTAALDQSEQRRAAAQSQFDQRYQGYQEQGQKIFNSIANSEVDPHHYWNSLGTRQKVSATIGMILGGIGSGLTHTPNAALQVLNDQITRDIDSQKMNLGKQESLLAHNLQQTHSLQSAYQLTRADLLDSAAAQLQRAAASGAGPKAMATAEQMKGTWQEKSIELRRQAAMQDFQIAQARQQMAAQQALAQALANGITPEVLGQLPPEHPLRKAGVFVPEDVPVSRDGKAVTDAEGKPLTSKGRTYYQAIDEDAAKKARPEFLTNAETLDKAKALKSFVEQHKGGAWGPEDKQRAAFLASDIKLSWNKAQEGLSRMNEKESEMLEKMIADPASAFGGATGRNMASVNEIMRAVLEKKENLKATYLMPKRGQ